MKERERPSAVYPNRNFRDAGYGSVSVAQRSLEDLFSHAREDLSALNILIYIPAGTLNGRNPGKNLAYALSQCPDVNVGISRTGDLNHAYDANVVLNYDPELDEGLVDRLGDDGRVVLPSYEHSKQFRGKKLGEVVDNLYSQVVENNSY